MRQAGQADLRRGKKLGGDLVLRTTTSILTVCLAQPNFIWLQCEIIPPYLHHQPQFTGLLAIDWHPETSLPLPVTGPSNPESAATLWLSDKAAAPIVAIEAD